jgi:hypothetical protein
MENKETAVDYYSNKIGRITSDLVTGKITGKQFVMLEIKLLDTAKQMEKEQHSKTWDAAIQAHEDRGHVLAKSWEDFEEYYAEKYGKTFIDLVSDEESKVHEVVRKLKEKGNK